MSELAITKKMFSFNCTKVLSLIGECFRNVSSREKNNTIIMYVFLEYI